MAQLDVAPVTSLNAYPLRLPSDTSLDYRIWTVEPVPQTPELREKIRSHLWKAAIRRPVLPMYVRDQFTYAIAGHGRQEPVAFVGEGERRYVVQATDDCRSIALDQLSEAEEELAALMLQAQLVIHLRGNPDLFGGHSANQYFLTVPDAPLQVENTRSNARRPVQRGLIGSVDIFRGFTFRVVSLQGSGLHLVLDVRSSYVGRETLASYLSQERTPSGLESDWGFDRWVNDYGNIKQSVYVIKPLDTRIGDVERADRRSTYDYLLAKYPNVRSLIGPDDRAVTIVYRSDDVRDETKYYTAAATLLKPKYTTQSPQVRDLGDTPAFPPAERQRRLEEMLPNFDGAYFAGKPIQIGAKLSTPSRTLPLPSVTFGTGERRLVLRPGGGGSSDDEARRRWGKRKLDALQQHGPFQPATFQNPFFVYPASLENDGLLDTFLARTVAACERFGQVSFDPQLSSYDDQARPQSLLAKLRGIAGSQRAGSILFALPPDPMSADRAYSDIKTQIALPTKCFSSVTLRRVANTPRRLDSYVERNALAMLVENGMRPWGLADPLTYEMQFGFDVARLSHGGVMGASVISDASGCDITFHNNEIKAREGIPTKVIGPFVLERLQHFFAVNGRSPRSILFQRDGRLLEAERTGIRTAIRKFSEAHPEQPTLAWAMVSVEKSTSVPIRLFREAVTGVAGAFSGTYVLQNPRVAYLVLAGEPSLAHGTPRPCRIEVVEASSGSWPDIIPILQDIFWLAQLNWNAPEIDMNLPIILRFTDQKLERYALELDGEDDDEDWDDVDEDGAKSRRRVAAIDSVQSS